MGPELIILPALLQAGLAAILVKLLARKPAPKSPAPHRVSVIIPARNEGRNLSRLLHSIRCGKILEVIVVDDESTDDTKAVALGCGARVVPSGGPPKGWTGKTWACCKGASVAKGDLLLFLDADCWFTEQGCDELIDRYNNGALSVLPWHAVSRPYEQLSALFTIVMAASNIETGLFGQCLLIDRETYTAVGGHGAVRGAILENATLCGVLRRHGVSTSSLLGKEMLMMRMYPDGVRSLIHGWSKGFFSGARAVAPARLILICGFISGLFAAWIAAIFHPWFLLYYIAHAALFWTLMRKTGSYSIWTALLYPVPLVFYHIIFIRHLLMPERSVSWKGRNIHHA